MSIELLTSVNTFDAPIGTVERDTAHAEGVWHRTVNFLIVDSKNKTTLFQNKKKQTYQ